MRRRAKLAGVALLVSAVFGGGPAEAAGSVVRTPAAATATPVVRVVDGDTLMVQVGRRTERVRVIGVDTPEVGECYAAEATRAMAAHVRGRSVRLVADRTQPDRDRYKRLLRHVVVGGRSVAPRLIAGGYGWEFTYGKAYPAGTAHRRAEAAARKARAGLWKRCPSVTRVASVKGRRCAIKGNVSSGGERIYHLPGQKYYNATRMDARKGERYFCSELDARKAGWRRSKV